MEEFVKNILIVLSTAISVGFLYFSYLIVSPKVTKKKAAYGNAAACRKVYREQRRRNYINYFWSDSMRFAWISLFLFFFILLGIALAISFKVLIGYILSIISAFIFVFFLIFSYISYFRFEAKAKAKLIEFENAIKAGIEKEISFEGDNIQSFSNDDEKMDTSVQKFEFAVETKKVPYPPFEKNAKKQPIIRSRKLEFLILSREYFSICKGATAFDLLDPKRGAIPKKCAEIKGAGECNEYYYSQMKNVIYEDETIKILFNNGDDPVEYKSPKALGKHKDILKAIKEKLRITERQRLSKIDEHKKYEDIEYKRHDDASISDENTDDNKEKEL